MTSRKNADVLIEITILGVTLYGVFITSVFAAENASLSQQFLVPYVVVGASTSLDAKTEGELGTLGGRFLRVDEDFDSDVSQDMNLTVETNVETKDEEKKDSQSRYDTKIHPTSWLTSLETKLEDFKEGWSKDRKEYRDGNTTRASWVDTLRLFKESFLAMINGGEEREVQGVPILSHVAVQDVSETSAHVIWKSSTPGFSRVYYAISTPVLMASASASITTWGMTDHDVMLTDLKSDTEYYYHITAYDLRGNATTSSEGSFTTKK